MLTHVLIYLKATMPACRSAAGLNLPKRFAKASKQVLMAIGIILLGVENLNGFFAKCIAGALKTKRSWLTRHLCVIESLIEDNFINLVRSILYCLNTLFFKFC